MKQNPKITDEEIALIKSAQAGNTPAFDKLYHRYKGFTTRILYDFIKDYDEAKDINNIVWLKVYNKLSKFTNYSSFGGWLRILTNRTAIDYLRELKPDRCMPEDIETIPIDIQNIDYGESVVDNASYNQVVDLFKQFSEDVRKVFELYYVNHLTVSEISKATGIPSGTIKSHLSRKRKQLKKLLKV